MHLLLIRHGESVDNVAGLYAGSRDSPLTNHGVLQTRRLGDYLAKRRSTIGPVTNIFASNLQRAYQTSEAIVNAQRSSNADTSASASAAALKVVQLPELREKDFGSSEGKKFGSRSQTDRDADGAVQSDSETQESMKIRIDRFLDNHLSPAISQHAAENAAVVVVAHGIILNVLLKQLLLRFPVRPTASLPEVGNRTGTSEFLPAWSNTGVLQAKLTPLNEGGVDPIAQSRAASQTQDDVVVPLAQSRQDRMSFMVEFTNNVDHLQGLKKTRGGIGSAKFDSRQRTMDSFFGPTSKKRKLDETKE